MIPEGTMLEVEADTFWCMSRLLQSILDNYTFAQPGIQRKTLRMQELMARIDGTTGLLQFCKSHSMTSKYLVQSTMVHLLMSGPAYAPITDERSGQVP